MVHSKSDGNGARGAAPWQLLPFSSQPVPEHTETATRFSSVHVNG